MKTENGGLPRGLHKLFAISVMGAGKLTYTVLYVIDCLCLLLGEKHIS